MNLKWLLLTLSAICLSYACTTKISSTFYVKARSAEELKVHAFERCGRKYKVISYEDDTALIGCLGKKD